MSQYEKQLATWDTLNAALRDESTSEDACWKLLRHEQKHKARLNFLLRIYGRASKLRMERERDDIAKGVPFSESKSASEK